MYGIYENGEVIARLVVPMTVKSNQPVSAPDTLSLKRQVSRRPAQRWEISTNVEPLSSSAHKLFVSLVTRGYSEAVQVLMPQNYGAKLARTSVSSAPSTNAGFVARDTQLTIKDCAGLIPLGTFIKFANHSKIYMLTEDCVDNGTLNIYPSLQTAVPNDTQFTFKDDVILTAQYDLDTVIGMSYSDGILMDMGNVTFIEKL